MEGKEVSWKSISGTRSGVVLAKFYRKKDNALLGYIVQMADGMKMIVHPKSFINTNQTK